VSRRVVIAGGGLAGALMAKYLGLAGHEVELYERRPDIRDAKIVRGRSINLAVSVRGLTALAEVGLRERVLEKAIPMRGRMVHAVDGTLSFQPYSKDPAECIQSISRGALNQLLLTEAGMHPNVTLRFEERCIDVDPAAGKAFFLSERTGDVTEATGDLVIGADGAFSAVRARLQREDRFDHSQSYLDAGYLELHIPPAEGGGFRMEENALHIWPRRTFMMIALPNHGGTYTVTCFWPIEASRGSRAPRRSPRTSGSGSATRCR
jgi:kynurenine 3-monooxygenase